MSPHHLAFRVFAVKSRITRSGEGGTVLSAMVIRFVCRRCRADDVVDPHRPRYPLAVDFPSPGPQLGMDTRGTVSTTAFGVDGTDVGDCPLLLGLAFSAGLFGGQVPGVVGTGDAQDSADPLNAEVGAVV